jgi:hypothetical protein
MPDSSYEQRKQAVIKEITAAFDGVSREGGVSWNEAWVIDDYGTDRQRAKARKKDTETRWQDVPERDIAYGSSCLSFFDEIGFRYYLPAYIVWCLRHIDTEDTNDLIYESDSYCSIIWHLRDDSPDLHQYHMARFGLFTREQSKAIAHFLEFAEERSIKIHRELWWPEMLSKGFSQEELDQFWPQEEKIHAERDDSTRALERYWKQFL